MESATNRKTRPVRVELDLLKSPPESVWVGLEDDNSPFYSKVGI